MRTKLTKEHRTRIGLAQSGVPKSKEHRQRMSEGAKRAWTPERRERAARRAAGTDEDVVMDGYCQCGEPLSPDMRRCHICVAERSGNFRALVERLRGPAWENPYRDRPSRMDVTLLRDPYRRAS